MVSLHQNVGMLVARRSTQVSGMLCKVCLQRKALAMTGTTLVAGWWGSISFFVTPLMILNNLTYLAMSLGMPPPLRGAATAELDDATIARLTPHVPAVMKKLRLGGNFLATVREAATVAATSPEQVVRYLQVLENTKSPLRRHSGASFRDSTGESWGGEF
jgi:hypothetical protein